MRRAAGTMAAGVVAALLVTVVGPVRPASAAANQPPVLVEESFAMAANGTLDRGASSGLLVNDTDPDGDPLTLVYVTGPSHGTASVFPDGSFTYTPAHGWSGTDTLQYRVSDGTDQSPIGAASIVVAPPDVAGAPTGVLATPGDQQALVRWTAPASTGAGPITGYTITPMIGPNAAQATVTSDPSPSALVTGLSNATSYSFRVAAITSEGTGPASTPSREVVPAAFGFRPYTSWGSLVDHVTEDLSPGWLTSAKRSTWVAQLAAGTKTEGDLVEAIRRDPDHMTAVDPVARLYRASFGRAPDASGLAFWVNRKRAGTWSVTKMADTFAASSEFARKYGTLSNRAFVTRLYTDVLGRTADPSGVDYWTGKLDRREKSRGGVMVGFSESSEYRRKQAENTDVAVAFIFLMGRAPTPDEADGWTSRQRGGATNAALAEELLDSMAYAVHVDP